MSWLTATDRSHRASAYPSRTACAHRDVHTSIKMSWLRATDRLHRASAYPSRTACAHRDVRIPVFECRGPQPLKDHTGSVRIQFAQPLHTVMCISRQRPHGSATNRSHRTST
eukprot:1156363-Pelagomonas_calceolata.AAC.10